MIELLIEEVDMGNVIARSAGAESIFEHFGEALDNGRRRDGLVRDTVEARLGPLEAGVATAKAQYTADKAALDDADKALLVIDGASDLEVGAVIDEIWNALGRPAASVEHALIAGRGKAQWTDGRPTEQPTQMAILSANIRRTTAPALQSGKGGWATRIDVRTALQAPAAEKVKLAETKLAALGWAAARALPASSTSIRGERLALSGAPEAPSARNAAQRREHVIESMRASEWGRGPVRGGVGAKPHRR